MTKPRSHEKSPRVVNPSTSPVNPSTPRPHPSASKAVVLSPKVNASTPQPLNPSTSQPLNPSTPQPLNASTPGSLHSKSNRLKKPRRGRKARSAPKELTRKIAKPRIPRPPHRRGLSREFFTLSEDTIIIDYLRRRVSDPSLSISRELYIRLRHSPESVRNRLRRYIAKLAEKDWSLIEREALVRPNAFAYFEKLPDGAKKVVAVRELPPTIFYQGGTSRPQEVESPEKCGETGGKSAGDYAWILRKMCDRDPLFALENSVLLLGSILNDLVDKKLASVEQVETFVKNAGTGVSLEDVFAFFKVVPLTEIEQ